MGLFDVFGNVVRGFTDHHELALHRVAEHLIRIKIKKVMPCMNSVISRAASRISQSKARSRSSGGINDLRIFENMMTAKWIAQGGFFDKIDFAPQNRS